MVLERRLRPGRRGWWPEAHATWRRPSDDDHRNQRGEPELATLGGARSWLPTRAARATFLLDEALPMSPVQASAAGPEFRGADTGIAVVSCTRGSSPGRNSRWAVSVPGWELAQGSGRPSRRARLPRPAYHRTRRRRRAPMRPPRPPASAPAVHAAFRATLPSRRRRRGSTTPPVATSPLLVHRAASDPTLQLDGESDLGRRRSRMVVLVKPNVVGVGGVDHLGTRHRARTRPADGRCNAGLAGAVAHRDAAKIGWSVSTPRNTARIVLGLSPRPGGRRGLISFGTKHDGQRVASRARRR